MSSLSAASRNIWATRGLVLGPPEMLGPLPPRQGTLRALAPGSSVATVTSMARPTSGFKALLAVSAPRSPTSSCMVLAT